MLDELTTDERLGYLKVCVANGWYHLRRSEREAITTALRDRRQGRREDPLYDGEGNHGQTVLIDLDRVEAIVGLSEY
jgi:hypothetical protein